MMIRLDLSPVERERFASQIESGEMARRTNDLESEIARRTNVLGAARKISGVSRLIEAFDRAEAGDPSWRDSFAMVGDDLLDLIATILRERFAAKRQELSK